MSPVRYYVPRIEAEFFRKGHTYLWSAYLFMQHLPFYTAPTYPLGPFQIFSKIRGDIRSSRLTTGVVDTGGKWEKSSIRKILIILLGHLWIVELTHKYFFAFKFTLRYLQPDINPIVCHRCHWQRWQICRRCRWYRCNLPPEKLTPVSTTLVKLEAKFATGVIDTGGKFATGVVDIGGQPWAANISANFRKNSKRL